MKRISLWAHQHKSTARIFLLFFYVLLHFTGFFLGDIYDSFNIQFTPLFYQVAIIMTLLGWFTYPFWKRKHVYKHLFVREKISHLLLVSATFLFIVYAGNAFNNNRNSFGNSGQAASIIYSTNAAISSETSTINKRVSKKSWRKKIRTEIQNLRKIYRQSTDRQKTLYITLAIFGAIFLGLGITALACNISCSGSEALGAVLFFGGLAGLIFGVIRIIKRINRGHPRNRKR